MLCHYDTKFPLKLQVFYGCAFIYTKFPDPLVPSPATCPKCVTLLPILCYQDNKELHMIFEVLTAVKIKLTSSGMWHDVNW